MNDEQGRPAVQAQSINEKLLQESGELHRRAGVARLVVPIQGNDQNGQRSSIPLD